MLRVEKVRHGMCDCCQVSRFGVEGSGSSFWYRMRSRRKVSRAEQLSTATVGHMQNASSATLLFAVDQRTPSGLQIVPL